MFKLVPFVFVIAAVISAVLGEIAGEMIHRRNLRLTGIGGGVFYARIISLAFMLLFMVAAVIAFIVIGH